MPSPFTTPVAKSVPMTDSTVDANNDFKALNVQDGLEEIDFRRETREPTGFINPNIDVTLDSIATVDFIPGSRQFSITPVSGSYEYFVHGQRVEISTTLNITIDDTNGVHIIYLNELGALTKYTGPGADKPYDGLEIKVGVIVWDVTAATHTWFGDPRSELSMTWGTQRRTHFISGTEISAGSFEVEGTLNGDGNSDSHAQIEVLVDGGALFHEDARWIVSHSATPTVNWEQELEGIAQIPILYRSGSGNGVWKKKSATDFPLYEDGANTIFWNEDTGSTWQLTNAGENQFVSVYLFATIDHEEPVIGVLGDHSENSPAQALHAHMRYPQGLPYPAMGFMGALIFQTSTSFTNTPHARLFAYTPIVYQTLSSDRYSIFMSYGGNANTGRWLETSPGQSSDNQPVLIPEDSFIRTVTMQSTSIIEVGKKFAFFRTSDLVTPVFELTIPVGGLQEHQFDITEFFSKGEEIAIQVTNGSINKPFVRFWIETTT